MPNYGHLSLSCTKIERPSPRRKPSCKVRFFANRHFRKYRPKVTVATLSPTVSHPVFQLRSQTAHVRFHRRKRVHTRLSEKDRTQRLTRRNTGRFGWGRYYYPRSVPHVHKHPRAGYQKGVLCRFWVLVGGALEERRKPSGQRCAYARRCPEAPRPRWAACSFPFLSKLRLVCPALRAFPCVRGEGWYHYPQRALRAAETPDGRLSKRLFCRFSCVPYLHLRKTLQDTANIRIYADIPPPTAMIEPFRPTNCQIRVHAEILVHDGILVYDIF